MEQLRHADAQQLVVAGSIAVVIVAVLAESAWLVTRRGLSHARDVATAAVMASGAVVTGAVWSAVYAVIWPTVGAAAPSVVVDLVTSNLVVEIVVVFVVWDAAGFAYHWVGHRTGLGWASHQAHHTGPSYDLSLAWRQSWFPLPALVVFPLVALTGGSLPVAFACAAISNLWQALVHTGAQIPPPEWFARAVVTPAVHRRHHEDGGAVNLGPVFTIWDRLAGTWREPRSEPQPLTVATESRNPVAIEFAGWRALLGSR